MILRNLGIANSDVFNIVVYLQIIIVDTGYTIIILKLNEDSEPIPSDYYYAKLGKSNPRRIRHLWNLESLRQILHNYTYLGHFVQLHTRTVSYRNHKVIKNDEEDMIVVKDTHEAIVSQKLWDRVCEMERSVSHGKRKSSGYVANLSGLIYCQDCGNKVCLAWNNTTNGSKKAKKVYPTQLQLHFLHEIRQALFFQPLHQNVRYGHYCT